MSDEIFSIAAPFADIAELAQGYVDRADGERLLLPLPKAMAQGAPIRFVVYLSDGTPAFAGAGLCNESSDQGRAVAPEQRFETLLDSLRFDARSRPVYDYIVAVRAAVYAESDAGARIGSAGSDAESSDGANEVDVDATAVLDLFAQHRHEASSPAGAGSVGDGTMPHRTRTPSPEQDGELAFRSTPEHSAHIAGTRDPSFIPPPIPTGLLTRPARTMHWQPAPPRRPTPRPASGLFRYGLAGLPSPARPPRPELDPSLQVIPAPRP
jgi:hypothetical protein